MALLGTSNTVTLGATWRHWRALSAGLGGSDSFALAGEIRQRGASANWSHRLTPLSTLTFLVTSLRSEALDVAGLESKQYAANLFVASRLSARSNATFGVRRVHFDSTVRAGYSENAVFVAFNIRF